MLLDMRTLVFTILSCSVLALVLPGWGGLSETEMHNNAGTALLRQGRFKKTKADYDEPNRLALNSGLGFARANVSGTISSNRTGKSLTKI